ncbi:MAG: TlpA disulfide reductase family protein [Gilvibacter sp.]
MKITFVTFLSVILLACSSPEENVLKGTAIGFAEGETFLWQEVDENNQPKVLDTITINNRSFSIDLSDVKDKNLRLLTATSIKGNLLVFIEGSSLKATVYKDSIWASRVSGSRSNDLYNEYMDQLRSLALERRANTEAYNQARQEQDGVMVQILQEKNNELVAAERGFKKNFITNNPNSLFTIMVLSELLDNKDISLTEAKRVIDATDDQIMNTNLGKTLVTSLEAVKNTDIGGKAPLFSAPMPNGTELALNEVMGKYTLIDFWASWCKPCRIENPNLVRAYNEYHDKGFNIIGVSLDQPTGKERWIKAIADDGLIWPQISNLKFWQDPIARQYDVKGIPASFLIDEEGTIVAKDLRGQQLDETLASLFSE